MFKFSDKVKVKTEGFFYGVIGTVVERLQHGDEEAQYRIAVEGVPENFAYGLYKADELEKVKGKK